MKNLQLFTKKKIRIKKKILKIKDEQSVKELEKLEQLYTLGDVDTTCDNYRFWK